MSEFWNKAGRVVSRRTMATLLVVVLVTIGFGFGLKKLDFATGQDSYMDPSSQVAKDNKNYQTLFGGESMVVLFTADEGKTIADLFTPANIAQFKEIETQMLASPTVQSVVSPLTLLQWTDDLITGGAASEIIARTIAREPDKASGCHIDMALMDTQVSVLANQALNYLVSGKTPKRHGQRASQSRALPGVSGLATAISSSPPAMTGSTGGSAACSACPPWPT